MDDTRKYGWSLPGCCICSHTVYPRQTQSDTSLQDKSWIPHYNGRGPTLNYSSRPFKTFVLAIYFRRRSSSKITNTLCMYSRQYYKLQITRHSIIMTCNVLGI